MGTEDWILKGTKIDNKNQKAKIKNLEQRLDSQKHNIKTTKQNHRSYIKNMNFALKIGSFFFST